jgi:GntR family transcriptional repressor for pyruvate dehydrogenase complex
VGTSSSARPPKTALLLAQRIVRDIDQQGLRPGDKLPSERLMMDSYDAGRGTLRESLRFLELQGVLSLKPGPGGGPVIQKPNADHLATTLAVMLQFDHARYGMIAEARAAFEPVVAQLAAERITGARLAELARTLSDMQAHLNDAGAFQEADRRFHRIVAWASQNSVFGFLVDVLAGGMASTLPDADQPVLRRRLILAAHQRIHDAIASSSPAEAGAAMRSHIQEVLAYAARKSPEALDRPVTWENHISLDSLEEVP